MANIGIFYGSTKGHTETVAQNILNALGTNNAELINIKEATTDDINRYKYLIFGTSTWGNGDLQQDWVSQMNILDEVNWEGKKVALFSLGDQHLYPDNFADGMGLLYDKLEEKGANVVGNWYPNGYIFNKSRAIRHGSFVGLVLDDDVQPFVTKPRIEKWTNLLKMEFKLN